MQAEYSRLIQGLQLNPPAPTHLIEQVQAQLGVAFPRDYAEFICKHNGAEGWVGDSYLMLYSLDLMVSLNDLGRIGLFLPGLVLFGSDGGGMDYLFDTRSSPFVVVTAPDIGATLDSVKYCAGNFIEFLMYLKTQGP